MPPAASRIGAAGGGGEDGRLRFSSIATRSPPATAPAAAEATTVAALIATGMFLETKRIHVGYPFQETDSYQTDSIVTMNHAVSPTLPA